MLRSCDEPRDQFAVLCDSAPVHSGLEAVCEEPEFMGVQLIRTAPYSAPLNPIEELLVCYESRNEERDGAHVLGHGDDAAGHDPARAPAALLGESH